MEMIKVKCLYCETCEKENIDDLCLHADRDCMEGCDFCCRKGYCKYEGPSSGNLFDILNEIIHS